MIVISSISQEMINHEKKYSKRRSSLLDLISVIDLFSYRSCLKLDREKLELSVKDAR